MLLGGQKLRPYIPMAKARGFTGAVNNYSSYRFFFKDINNYTLAHVIDILMDLGFKTQFSACQGGWVIKIELIT